jgi:hypothetical protein
MNLSAPISEDHQTHQRLAAWASGLIVAGMIACVAQGGVLFGQRLVTGWNGTYLVIVCFLVSLEALYTKRALRGIRFLSRRWLIQRLSEWIVILVILKVVVFLVHDVAFGAELSSWQRLWLSLLRGLNEFGASLASGRQNFFNAFFTGEYVVACLFVFTAWLFSTRLAEDLIEIDPDLPVDLQFDAEGHPFDRSAARRKLLGHIFLIGSGLVFLTGMLRVDLGLFGFNPPGLQASILNVLIYFLLGFVLLSLTRLAILRAEWRSEDIPIDRQLTRRWIIYTAIFLVALGFFARLLPTAYSVDLLSSLGAFLNLVLALGRVILILLLAPILYVINWLLQLFRPQASATPPPQVPPLQLPPEFSAAPIPWLEVIKSLIFWTAFVALVVYAFRQYLEQRPELKLRLQHFVSWRRLSSLWQALRQSLHRLNRRLSRAIVGTLDRWQPPPITQSRGTDRFHLPPDRSSTRQRILFFYRALVQRGGEAGFARRSSQTPYEYSTTLRRAEPTVASEIDSLTGEFVEARYSRHQIEAERVKRVRQYWQRIKQALRKK